jgi:hypothetical protein
MNEIIPSITKLPKQIAPADIRISISKFLHVYILTLNASRFVVKVFLLFPSIYNVLYLVQLSRTTGSYV